MEETIVCCKYLLAGDKFFPSLSYSHTFDLGKPEERFLTSPLLVQSRSRSRRHAPTR